MQKVNLENLSDLIGLLYDASTQTNLWPEFCRQLMIYMESNLANIKLIENRSFDGSYEKAHFMVDIPFNSSPLYNERFHAINPYHQRSFHLYRPGYIGLSHEVCSPNEFEKTEFYQDFMRLLNVFHCCQMTILDEQDLMVNIAFGRAKKIGIYEDNDKDLLQFLMPHLQRAFRITHFVSSLNTENKVLAEVLDKLPQGVIVISCKGQIIFINRSAKRIVDNCDGLSIDKQGKLRAAISNETKELTRLIESANRPDLDAQLNKGGVIHLNRPSGLRPLSLIVAPLSQGISELNLEQSATLIFITDPELKIEPCEQVFQRLYQLTPAESKLAVLLVQGKSVTEASEILRVTANTTRTHLKRIFSKTTTCRQSDLVKLLINSPSLIK